uniref:Autotransporter domain-containing protein n=1 Tax=viral metagenome TaxID=1070528 RepID=A0A6M3IQR4_9ZZZZ
MKKLITLLIILSLFVPAAFAFEFQKENLGIGIEYNGLEKDVDSTKPLTIDVLGITAGLKSKIDDLETNQILGKVQYKLSEYLTPYALLGGTNLKFRQTLQGNINSPFLSGETNIIETRFDGGQSFTWGLGAQGKVMDLPQGLLLSYDVRRTAFDSDDNSESSLIPSFLDLKSNSNVEVEYAEINTSLILSKAFELDNVVKSLSPYIGYRFTNISMNLKNTYHILIADVTTEENRDTNFHSMVLGVTAKVNKNLDVSVGGSLFGERGFGVKATYSF